MHRLLHRLNKSNRAIYINFGNQIEVTKVYNLCAADKGTRNNKEKEKLYNRKYTCIKNDNEITIFTATATAATVLVFAFSLGSQGAIIIPMI